MKSIITLTMNPCLDLHAQVDEVLPEDKLRCFNPVFAIGGGGINISRALQSLGGTSHAIYCSGGPTRAILESLLQNESFRREALEVEAWTRQNFIIQDLKTKSQFRFNMPGEALKRNEWEKCIKFIFNIRPAPSYLVLSGSLPPGVPEKFYAYLTDHFSGNETRIIVDTSGAPFEFVCKEKVYLVKPNYKEFCAYLGKKWIKDSDLENYSKDFLNHSQCEVLILSLGERGVLLASKEKTERILAPEVKVKSKIGAGDSVVAGLIYGLANDFSLFDSARLGVAAGSAAVMTDSTELCNGLETWNLYKEIQKFEI